MRGFVNSKIEPPSLSSASGGYRNIQKTYSFNIPLSEGVRGRK